MKIYLVGGAVRDKLLGLPVKERDYVVVGATVNDMLKQGYRQVGKEFPVFLDPKKNEEYALARMERKTALGYKGFEFDTSPDVTLEDDLIRRDLTINAMAETPDGKLIDPYGGQKDLELKILRHVSPAFAEDPVRILRVGRFLARYAQLGFQVAPETLQLMRKMVAAGEVNALVAERVWKELERVLGEPNPEKFFTILEECHALPILFPDIINTEGMTALRLAAQQKQNNLVRWAVLLHHLSDAPKKIAALCNRYRIPNAYRELAILTASHYPTALRAKELSPAELLQLFTALDIFRRENRFDDFLAACAILAQTHKTNFDLNWLKKCALATKDIDVQTLITKGLAGSELAMALKEKRKHKIAEWLKKA